MDHSRTPVLEALAEYHQRGYVSFTPPGHKQGRGTDKRVVEALGLQLFQSDILAISGLDDRQSSNGTLARAQDLMADAVHAERTFFSTCGSSLSVKSAMLSVAGPHEKLLVGRDAHKSVIAGLILSGIEPVWVEPQWDPELNLAHPPTPEAYEHAFLRDPDAKGALVTSPTPYGTCADIAGIVESCHRRGKPIIVDEAWGAHLPFHDDLPAWAMDAGADVCVTSVHKMGCGLEQGSVYHQQGNLVDPTVLKARADLFDTTSPSVLIYAGLDGWRRQMVENGHVLLTRAMELVAATREQVERIDGLHVHGVEFTGEGRAHDQDRLQVVIDVSALGATGYEAADWLRANCRINMHLADHRRVGAQFTQADNHETAAALIAALGGLGAHRDQLAPAPSVAVPTPHELRLPQVHLPRDAFFGTTEDVPAREAAGRVSAEMLTPYPPGIPTVLPGEQLNEEVVKYLVSGVQAGMKIPDAAHPDLSKIRVVRNPD